ncbi:MAG: ABC transporter substrate-binding protein [Lachnospiraceae bacterium]|nr:ABC transporter substrate-binding protein [Lachnospiraceae bacterium]
MKKKLALLLAGIMTLSLLTACGGGSSAPAAEAPAAEAEAEAEAPAAEGGEEAAAPAASDAAAEAAAARIESGDFPTVVIAYMNFAGQPAGMQRISEKMSEITREKLGINVELMIMDSASYRQNMNLMLASGEQVDLFSGLVGFMPSVNKGYLYDLEEDGLLQTYGQGLIDAFTETELNGCRVNGTLYGIPVKKDDAAGLFGISIPQEYLDAIGYDYASKYEEGSDIIYTDLDEIEVILGQLKEQYPDKTTFYIDPTSIVSQCLEVDRIGGDVFGVLADPANSLEISNLFESQPYLDLVHRMYKWNQMGFFSKDAITETQATTVQVKAGSLCAYKTATKPGIKQQESNLCGMPVIIFQCGPDFKSSSTYNSMPWCMNQNTEDPIAAMQVLNEMYTNPDLATLLCWGEEGVEWVETEDGHITFPEGVDAQNSEYYNNVNWELGNQFIARIWEGDDLTIWERMQEFNDNAPASKAMGFTWDNSEYSTEYTALANVYDEYQKQIELGFVDPDVAIPEMVERLNAAGLQEYMQAKQDAIDAWAAATQQ